MKRIKVITHLSMGASHEMEKVTVEAFCKKCSFWDQDSRCSFHMYGDCCRFPKKPRKHADDWCGEFEKHEEEAE